MRTPTMSPNSFEEGLALSKLVAIGEKPSCCLGRLVDLAARLRRGGRRWSGREAELEFQPFEQWQHSVDEDTAQATYGHIAHSPSASIEKAAQLLGYAPRYSSLQAVSARL